MEENGGKSPTPLAQKRPSNQVVPRRLPKKGVQKSLKKISFKNKWPLGRIGKPTKE